MSDDHNPFSTPEALDEFFLAYVEAALWSSSDVRDDGTGAESLRDDLHLGVEDLRPETRSAMRKDCEDFIAANRGSLWLASGLGHYRARSGEYSAPALAGHDFWLSRNGHGAGFWDRGLGSIGDRLHEAAAATGERTLWVGDDGTVDQT